MNWSGDSVAAGYVGDGGVVCVAVGEEVSGGLGRHGCGALGFGVVDGSEKAWRHLWLWAEPLIYVLCQEDVEKDRTS